MAEYQTALALVAAHYDMKQWIPQPASDWTGPFPLPPPLAEYYARLGPSHVIIHSYGNSFFLPALVEVWKYQEGYRWDITTYEPNEEWNDDWLIVADNGEDPFILSRATGKIFFTYHDEPSWSPVGHFASIEDMVTCILILGLVVRRVSNDDFVDNEGLIRPQYVDEALRLFTEYFGSESEAYSTLSIFEWTRARGAG